jgi:hypothetical protein
MRREMCADKKCRPKKKVLVAVPVRLRSCEITYGHKYGGGGTCRDIYLSPDYARNNGLTPPIIVQSQPQHCTTLVFFTDRIHYTIS